MRKFKKKNGSDAVNVEPAPNAMGRRVVLDGADNVRITEDKIIVERVRVKSEKHRSVRIETRNVYDKTPENMSILRKHMKKASPTDREVRRAFKGKL